MKLSYLRQIDTDAKNDSLLYCHEKTFYAVGSCRSICSSINHLKSWEYVMKRVQSSQIPSIHTVTSSISIITRIKILSFKTR
jgi:hypothetical protein